MVRARKIDDGRGDPPDEAPVVDTLREMQEPDAPEDLADPDARAVAIRAEHSELDQALAHGADHVSVAGSDVNIRLHLAMHEIVASQLADDDPPEVNETAQRLLAAGYDRHEVLHMLAGAVSGQIHATLPAGSPYDLARHVAALRALPASREGQRAKQQPETSDRRRARTGRSTRRRRRRPPAMWRPQLAQRPRQLMDFCTVRGPWIRRSRRPDGVGGINVLELAEEGVTWSLDRFELTPAIGMRHATPRPRCVQ